MITDKPIDLKKALDKFLKRQKKKEKSKNAKTKGNIENRG